MDALRNIWTSKPPLGAQVDRTHPLAPDLACWLMNEQVGYRVTDVVNGCTMLGDVAGTITPFSWKPSVTAANSPLVRPYDDYGIYLSGGVRARTLTGPNLANRSFTILLRYAATPDANFGAVCTVGNDAGGTRELMILRHQSATQACYSFYADDLFPTVPSVTGRLITALYTYDAVINQQVFYQDGQFYGARSTGGDFTGGSTPRTWNLGWMGGGIPAYMASYITCLMVWGRVLTAREAAAISVNPYQVCSLPGLRDVYGAAGSGSVLALFDQYYRRMRST